MEVQNKATRIDLFSLKTRQMRAFHMSWFAFFLCFFAWFGIAPLLEYVADDIGLTKNQKYNSLIASVAITIFARLFIGWLCDRIGPRLSYTFLLIFGSLPVMGIALANSYESFLLFRLGIGVIGASFVITQYHTSVMFAPNVVGTANATSAGWGNLGGGVTQIIMPLVFAGFVAIGYVNANAWRASMVAAGAVCFIVGIAYYFLTTDLPNGNFKELRESGELIQGKKDKGGFWLAAKDYRVWALFFIYAACFGIELTINGMAAMYYREYFGLGIATAGLVAGLFGLMNVFARTTGGFISDRFVKKSGLKGRVQWLFIALLAEGVALVFFSQMRALAFAIPVMIVFSLFVQMSEGATYSIVPFINKKALGPVSGIVGAGGNVGAVCAGLLLRFGGMDEPKTLMVLGFLVFGIAFLSFLVRFSPAVEAEADRELQLAIADRREKSKATVPALAPVGGLATAGGRAALRPMDLLRIYLGIALVIKGVYFIINMGELESTMVEGFGQNQQLVAWAVVFAHVVGGAALALGFATRVAAAANAAVLAGAVGVAISGSAISSLFGANVNFQFSMFVLVTLVLFIWRGSGPLSLDHMFRGEQEAHPSERQ